MRYRDVVHITIDLDGLEPGLMPAVGTPEPGGLSWREATTLLRRTFERKRVVACDVVELCSAARHRIAELHRREAGLQTAQLSVRGENTAEPIEGKSQK